jgi:radical SAM protein with 4Fe4S-binding SPASM domain
MHSNKNIKKLLLREKTIKQKYNFILTYCQFKVRKLKLHSYPIKLTIDPCNFCNLHCVLCPVGTGTQGRKLSIMSFDTFKQIIDECGSYIWEIDLFNWGEPLLNKEIFKMINYARKMKIDVTISTNLNHFNEDICSNLIESGLNRLIISLDGASQDTVEKYQKGCNFDSVVNNIKKIVHMKEILGSRKPFIVWRFLINRYNENEIERAKKLSEELNIDELEIGAFRCDMGKEILLNNEAQYENVKSWLPVNEELSMYDYKRKKRKGIKDYCRKLWFESVINPNGSVSPCCTLWYEKFDFGNIKDSSFKEIWNGEKYQKARRISRGDHISIYRHICYICKQNNAQI